MGNLMTRRMIIVLSIMVAIFSKTSFADDYYNRLPVDKVYGDLSVMVLGSGGPLATTSGRASAGYLIFVDGQPKILMDCGGGTYLRLGQSGANIKDLDIILLSHLHIDHMGDLDAIVKDMYFQNRVANVATQPIDFPDGRTEPFTVYGPGANNAPFAAASGVLVQPLTDLVDPMTAQYPATSTFVDEQFNVNTGLDRYLHVFSQMISGGIFAYNTQDVSPNWMGDINDLSSHVIYDKDGLVITAVGVNHGPVPALAFRIDYKGKSIVYSGDTSSAGSHMISLSQDADLVIYDTAITDTLPNKSPRDKAFFLLHTTPSRMGEVAAAANPKKLVLSHLTPNTEPNIDVVKDAIRANGYTGRISVAEDLKVFNVGRDYDHH
ncbi:MAG: MBL fold metallo-hydrolase [Gammaproteobacteria bacterium]